MKDGKIAIIKTRALLLSSEHDAVTLDIAINDGNGKWPTSAGRLSLSTGQAQVLLAVLGLGARATGEQVEYKHAGYLSDRWEPASEDEAASG